MRSFLLAVAGLVLGGLGALGYSHYLGEGKELADARAALADAQASLTKAVSDAKDVKSENTALSDQVQRLQAGKADLQKQLEVAKTVVTAPVTTPAPANPNMGAMMTMAMAQQTQSRLLMLKSRLHLTPEQETAVKAALDAEAKRGEEMATKMMAGGKVDPQAMGDLGSFKSVDQTLNDILTPDQQTAYAQMQADQKNSAAEMMASVALNQLSPMLQLTDSQKDQVYNALAQAQLQTQDPNWIKANTTPGDPTAYMDAAAKAKEDALAKILTPDQLATYHQQAQGQLDMQKAMMKNFSTGAGVVSGVSSVVVAPAPTVQAAPAPNPPPANSTAPSNP